MYNFKLGAKRTAPRIICHGVGSGPETERHYEVVIFSLRKNRVRLVGRKASEDKVYGGERRM